MSIGKNLRRILKTRELKLTQIEEMSRLSYADVRNILHDRSQNMEKIGKIVAALNIPLEAIVSPSLEKQEIDITIYCKVVRCLEKIFHSRNKIIKKEALDELIANTYTYASTHIDESEEKLMGFAEGVIHSSSHLL